MDEQPDAIDTGSGSTRRDLLKQAAVGSAIVWVAPTILASRAGAQGTCLSFLADWNTVAVPTGVASFNGGAAIGSTGFQGTNVEVVSPAFGGAHPPWAAGMNWLDLVGLGSAGSITGDVVIPCSGTYELTFTYSRYTGSGQTLTVAVDSVVTGPILAPAPTSPATFSQTYGPFTIGDVVTVTLTGAGSGAAGPATGNISFDRV